MTNVKKYLENVRSVNDFQNIVNGLAAKTGIIKAKAKVYDMTEEKQEMIKQMHIVNDWIIDRLESGAYSGNDSVLNSLRENRTYLLETCKELRK